MKKFFSIFALLFCASLSFGQIIVPCTGTMNPAIKTTYNPITNEKDVRVKSFEEVVGNAIATNNKATFECDGQQYTIYRTAKTAFIVVPCSNKLFKGYCKKKVGTIENNNEE